MKRKSPIRHVVQTHKRQGKTIQKFLRGKGQKTLKIAKPTIQKPTTKHFIVKYETFCKGGIYGDGIWVKDSTNCFVPNKKDILIDLQSHYIGKPPEMRITKTELQAPPEKRLKPLLDVDTRTRSRMDRGYILDQIQIEDINLPPLRSTERFEDNIKKMKATQSVPPVHLSPTPSGKFEIEDGVHRIHVAKKLGYKSIPALVYYGRLNE